MRRILIFIFSLLCAIPSLSEQGSDSNDASDGGQPPPAEDIALVKLTVGDSSGSHSERYNMVVKSVVGDTRTIKHTGIDPVPTRKPPDFIESIQMLGRSPDIFAKTKARQPKMRKVVAEISRDRRKLHQCQTSGERISSLLHERWRNRSKQQKAALFLPAGVNRSSEPWGNLGPSLGLVEYDQLVFFNQFIPTKIQLQSILFLLQIKIDGLKIPGQGRLAGLTRPENRYRRELSKPRRNWRF